MFSIYIIPIIVNTFFAHLLNTYLIAARKKIQILKNGTEYQGAWPPLKYGESRISKIKNIFLSITVLLSENKYLIVQNRKCSQYIPKKVGRGMFSLFTKLVVTYSRILIIAPEWRKQHDLLPEPLRFLFPSPCHVVSQCPPMRYKITGFHWPHPFQEDGAFIRENYRNLYKDSKKNLINFKCLKAYGYWTSGNDYWT